MCCWSTSGRTAKHNLNRTKTSTQPRGNEPITLGSSPTKKVEKAVGEFCAKHHDPSWVKSLTELCCVTGKPPREAIWEAINYYLNVHAVRSKHGCSDTLVMDVLTYLEEMMETCSEEEVQRLELVTST